MSQHSLVSGRIRIEEEYKAEVEKYKYENFEKDGKHFSHDHPLRLMCGDDDDDDKYKSLCSLCGVPILSAPSYTCTHGCKFFLHQPCALYLPPKLIYKDHSSGYFCMHILYIITEKSSSSYHYQCKHCEFSLHPLVAFPHLEIRTSHMSHASHSLVVFCKWISCQCDACGREHKGFFFHCRDCDFWIHQDCTFLPIALKFPRHRDPFILVYSLPINYRKIMRDELDDCIFCDETRFVKRHGIYFCPQSSRYAHAACGSTHQFASQAKLNTIQLPDDEWDMNTFPISVLRRYAEINPPVNVVVLDDHDDEDDVKLTIKEYHKHSLVLIEEDSSSRSELELAWSCDLCTRSIPINSSSSFHKCETCDFAAHKLCADILPLLELSLTNWTKSGKHYPDPSETFFNSIFNCFTCRRPCNGLCYNLEDTRWFVDLECMAAPSTINHASHGQGHHLLFRCRRFTDETPPNCCPDDSFGDVYICTVCDYTIHTRCAMLPKRIVCSEYDEHPLHLAFTAHPTSNYSFCEVCEEDMDYRHWFYECGECDNCKSFHINCIPSLGRLSKVKFGGTLRLPDSHAHPLALTRMLTVPSQRCGSCSEIIRGMLDEMAFFCSRCHFWLHFPCAKDLAAISNTTARLPVP